MRSVTTIRAELEAAQDENRRKAERLAELVTKGSLNPQEKTELSNLQRKLDDSHAEVNRLDREWRDALIEHGSKPGTYESGEVRSVHLMKQTESRVDVFRSSETELRDAAWKMLENEHRDQKVPISDATAGKLEKDFGRKTRDADGRLMFDGAVLARRFLITESDAYRSAWQKALRDAQPAWTPAEAQAINELRATEQSLTDASGGYGVPVALDPTIIVTSGAGVAPLLDVARIENITSDVWKGVASDGVTFTATAEATAATASQATLSQPSITPEKALSYIPYSFEIEGDYPNFAGEMAKLIEQAWIDYLAVETATGTSGLVGIFTALAGTSSEVTVTTDGALGPEDAFVVWNALGERYRPRSSWFMNVSVESQLRNSTNDAGLYTTNLSTNGIGPLLGKRVLLSDYAPSFSGTTGSASLAVLGDFSRFVVVQRVGMSIERVPHVVNSSGVPTGQRAWLAWARAGSDSVDDNGFVLLANN